MGFKMENLNRHWYGFFRQVQIFSLNHIKFFFLNILKRLRSEKVLAGHRNYNIS